jgi:hypothetical protein
MTSPETDGTTRAGRRRERRDGRRRLVAGIVAGALLLTGFGLLATDSLRLGGGPEPGLAVGAKSTPRSTTTTAESCRALTSSNPLRLWIGGDSLAGTLGQSLGKIAGDTGVVQPYFDSRVSSGLGNPSFFDWPKHATEEMARLSPEIVVFIIGTNDWTFPTSSTTSTDAAGQPTWRADYAQRVEEMLNILLGTNRKVIWVGAPIIRDKDQNDNVQLVNAIARSVVAQHRDAQYFDDYALFSDADGKYAASLPDDTGKLVQVRAGDGVHFTPEGGDRLARAIFKIIDTRCHVQAQAVPTEPKQAIETAGSQEVPGTRRTTSGGNSGVSPNTTPTVASPTPTTKATATTVTPIASTTPTTPTTIPAPPTTVPAPTTTHHSQTPAP